MAAFLGMQTAGAQFNLMNAPPGNRLAASKIFTIDGDLVRMYESTDLSHPVAISAAGIIVAERAELTAAGGEPAMAPQRFELAQNFPNPFNMSTKIVYSLPARADVRLVVYDIAGRRIAELVNATMEPGVHAAEFSFADIASGTYFYRITATDRSGRARVDTKKMILMK